MVDPTNNSLLVLYDDAQSIYNRKGKLDFSLSSVGIQARGRTQILKVNYRNPKEVLDFAHGFLKEFVQPTTITEESIPIIEPVSYKPKNKDLKPKIYKKKKDIVGVSINAQFPKNPHIIIDNTFDKDLDILDSELRLKIKKITLKKNYEF